MGETVIGITTFITGDSLKLPATYITAVSGSGGVPFVLAKIEDDTKVKAQVDAIDGLVLTGGDDIDPSLFGEDPHQKLGNIEPGRDAYEAKLIEYALEQNKPVLAICRGAQILNISEGGTMYQDIYDQIEGNVMQHTQIAPRDYLSHTINIAKGTKLRDIIGTEEVKTNSFHHQANNLPADGYVVSARSNDGVVEAMESKHHEFVMAIQWHPEGSYKTDETSQKLFNKFIEVAGK